MFSVPSEKDKDKGIFRRFSNIGSTLKFSSNLMNVLKGKFSTHKDIHSKGGMEEKDGQKMEDRILIRAQMMNTGEQRWFSNEETWTIKALISFWQSYRMYFFP